MAGQEIVQRPPARKLTLGRAAELDPFQVGKVLAASGFFPDARQEAQAVAKVIAGMELGFGPMAAMTGVHIIEGKPSLAANLLATCVKRHPAYDYRVRKHEDNGCEIEFFEQVDGKRESIGVSTFTSADAQRAGIANKGNFKKYPKAMMFARALSQGVRWYCPDVTAGAPAYVPEELGAEVDEEGEPVEAIRPAAANGGDPEPAPEPEADAEPVLDDERARSVFKAVAAVGPSIGDLNLMFGTVGAEGPKLNRADSIAKAIRALTPEQADQFEQLLNREADRAAEGGEG
jgi:hypothetical protein